VVYIAKNNVLRYTYYRNWAFYLQRITAVITLVFVLYHLWTLRISAALFGTEITFTTMVEQLSNPGIFVFYVIGLLSATFHFANGLWAFLINWGIAVGVKAQQVLGWVTGILFVILSIMGLQGLFAFL